MHRRFSIRWLATMFALAMLPAAPGGVQAAGTVTIGTAGVMGMYYPLGGALCRMVNVTRKVHKLRCSVEPSEGSAANIRDVIAGDVDMGIAQSDTQYYAREGSGPFRDKPQAKLRALFNVYPETLTLMAREDANIRALADLRGKRVSLGTPGSGTRATMDLVLEAAGVQREQLRASPDIKIVEMPPTLCDSKIDAFGFVAGHPNPVLMDAAGGCRVRVVPVAGAAIDALVAQRPYYTKTVVPGGLYKGAGADVPTIGTMASIVVSADMPDEVAYAITRAVFENFEDFRKLHPALGSLTKDQAVRGGVVPAHPGALKYFREAGLVK